MTSIIHHPPVAGPSASRAADVVIKVDLDDRCFLFPTAKNIAHLQFLIHRGERLRLELGFAYNVSQSPIELIEMAPYAVADFSRKLVDAVYRATSVLFIADGQTITVVTLANGYNLQIGDFASQRDLFISTGCIWRVCGAFCRASDFLTSPKSH
jgi:hypothetical protein